MNEKEEDYSATLTKNIRSAINWRIFFILAIVAIIAALFLLIPR